VRIKRNLLHRSAWLVLLFAVATSVQAAKVPFSQDEVIYDLADEPLANFLEGFFASQGMPLRLSPGVVQDPARLNGPRNGTPAQIYASIARSNQLISYYDGSIVFVYKASERLTRYLSLPPTSIRPFMRTFNELRLGDDANVVDASPANGLIAVTGTWRFVEQVEELGNAMRLQQADVKPKVTRYFPLRYAIAGDTSITVGNRQVTVPGVASVLQLANGIVGATQAQTQLLRPSARRVGGTGLNSIGNDSRFQPASYPIGLEPAASAQSAPLPLSAAIPASPYGPQIIADPHRNAIIVRDEPDKMKAYEELIQLLDIEPQMVEIEATIIDVNRDLARNIGVDWQVKRRNRDFLFSPDGSFRPDLINAIPDNMTETDLNLLRALAGFNVSSVIGTSTQLTSRINLLERADVLSIVSRPQILTLNDTEAVIEGSREVFVPVGGTYEVDLFQVIAGTVLRVTPHVIEEADGRKRIRMLLTIEDGTVEIQSDRNFGPQGNFATQNNIVPTVNRSAINTQALLDEGQSLLIGGLVTDSSSYVDGGVPGLRRLPIIGRAFSSRSRSHSQRERLFLITPRLTPSNQITSQFSPSDREVRSPELLKEPELHR